MANECYYIRAITINGTHQNDATAHSSVAEAIEYANRHYHDKNVYKDVWIEDSAGARILASIKTAL